MLSVFHENLCQPVVGQRPWKYASQLDLLLA